jgi:hypothetical protein
MLSEPTDKVTELANLLATLPGLESARELITAQIALIRATLAGLAANNGWTVVAELREPAAPAKRKSAMSAGQKAARKRWADMDPARKKTLLRRMAKGRAAKRAVARLA